MPIIVKLNSINNLSVRVEKHRTRAARTDANSSAVSALTVENQMISALRNQTRIIQRAAANAFLKNCADLETDLTCSAVILSNIFSNISSARRYDSLLPNLFNQAICSADPDKEVHNKPVEKEIRKRGCNRPVLNYKLASTDY